jgi:hypothetical protein
MELVLCHLSFVYNACSLFHKRKHRRAYGGLIMDDTFNNWHRFHSLRIFLVLTTFFAWFLLGSYAAARFLAVFLYGSIFLHAELLQY